MEYVDERPHSIMSDPLDLERNYSDDSSVFSGLAEASHQEEEEGDAENDEQQIYADDYDDEEEEDDLGRTQTMGTGSEMSDDIILHRRQYESDSQQTSSVMVMPKGIIRGPLGYGYNNSNSNIDNSTLLSHPDPTYSSSKMGGEGSSTEESDAYSSLLPEDAPTESTMTERSHRSRLREMPPMVDSDTAFGLSSTISSSQPPGHQETADGDGSYHSQHPDNNNQNNPWLGRNNTDAPLDKKNIIGHNNTELFPDSDTNTQMTWGSANDIPRPKGTVKLVSQVTFLGETKPTEKQTDRNQTRSRDSYQQRQQQQQQQQNEESRNPIEECPTDDSGSRIVDMLNDFEKHMDASLRSFQDDDDIINNNNQEDAAQVLSELQDAVPRRVKSEEDGAKAVLTPHKARKLQRILHKARKEVEILRDNNEQYKSEIEQMEEEHKSELKLIEDRTKQKLAELRSMYQEEIDKLVLEKDAAVIEAGRQAARYAESGKKQVSSMKKQLERLTATATATIKEKVEEAGRTAMAQKDKEIAARLGALRTSYENELQKVRKECDLRIKSEVEKAVSSVAQRVRLNQDVLVSELRENIENLRKERWTIETVLKAVKGNFEKHYPDEMILYAKKSEDFAGTARKLLDEGSSPSNGAEKDLKEVIETFAFLLECQEKKVASAQYLTEIEETKRERNEVYGQMRKELLLRHRAEMEHLRKERDDALEKLKVVEANFKNMGREKRFLEEKHRRAMENHRIQLERLKAEKEASLEMEKSRKDLAVAMATGQNQMRCSTVKPRDSTKLTVGKSDQEGIDMKQSDSSDASCNIPEPPTKNVTNLRVQSIEHQKYGFESASVRKARTFLVQHSPRDSPRFSPSQSTHRRSMNFSEKKAQFSDDSPIKSYDLVVTEKRGRPTKESEQETSHPLGASSERKESTIDVVNSSAENSNPNVTSNLETPDPDEVRPPPPKSALDPTAIPETRCSVDPLPDIKNSKSDLSNSSVRSRDTILSNLRNQAKKVKDAVDDSDVRDRIEPVGDVPDNEPSARRKSFAILRSFKNKKEIQRTDAASERTYNMNEQEDSSGLMTRSFRRARIIKNLFESNGSKNDESRRSRASLDESISSLHTNTGTMAVEDSKNNANEDLQTQWPDSGNSPEQVLDARQSKAFIESRTAETRKLPNVVDGSATVTKKPLNTLGMFVHAKKTKEFEADAPDRVATLDTMSSEINSNFGIESTKDTETSRTTNSQNGSQVGTESRVPSKEVRLGSASKASGSSSVHFNESSATHLNLKKPPLDGFQSSKEAIVTSASHINAKKRISEQVESSVVDSIFTMRNPSSESAANENAVPKTISVTSPTKRSSNATFTAAASASGHTLLTKPLGVTHSNKHQHHQNPEMVSNLTAGTSPTALSSDDDGLVYDSQAQMRKYPPLTDDEVSDDDSALESEDRYQTMDSPKKNFCRDYDIPLVASKSVDGSSEETRDTIVVQGQPIRGVHGNNHVGLASFRNSYARGKDLQETSSNAGSNVSEATTAITAHTRSVTFSNSSSRRATGNSLPLTAHHYDGGSSFRTSHTGTSGRFAALKARVRVRKEALHGGN
jgi:hypothetical protein